MPDKPVFSVIEGGLSPSKKKEKHALREEARSITDMTPKNSPPKKSEIPPGKFKSAEATRSRLMGVIGMHITCTYDDPYREIHHFLYLDAEEYGIDNYEVLFTTNREEIEERKSALFGGLGEPWVDITEKGAMYLLNFHKEINFASSLEFPEIFAESYAIKIEPVSLSEEEIAETYNAICVPINSDMQLCNYYIMRLCGMDFEMSDRLRSPEGHFDSLPVEFPAALCSNTIEPDDKEDHSYICESLISVEDDFCLTVSRIKTDGKKVTYFEVTSTNAISSKEASMIMKKHDYIILTTLADNSPKFREKTKKALASVFKTMTFSEYDNADFMMVFNNNNAHVNKLHYRIDNDLFGMIFYTHDGEIVISAASPIKAEMLKNKIEEAEVAIMIEGSISFDRPVMASFLQSGIPSFAMFLANLEDF